MIAADTDRYRIDPAWWPDAVSAGEVVYPPGGTYGPRTQSDYQLVAIHSGRVRLEVDAVAYAFGAGSVCLLRPGHREFFAFATDEPTRHSWVTASAPVGVDPLPAGPGAAPPSVPLAGEVAEIVSLVVGLERSGGRMDPDLTRALALAAFLTFGRAAGIPATAPARHPAVGSAERFIHANLGQDLTLEEIARAAAVTPEHLCRLFRATLGTTPISHLWAERTREGLRLLGASGLAVQEVARRCGFRDQAHFSRRVRIATGRSPTAYRRSCWNQGLPGAYPPPVGDGTGRRRP
jgi:AraC family transcriptional regulator of arabinose operon